MLLFVKSPLSMIVVSNAKNTRTFVARFIHPRNAKRVLYRCFHAWARIHYKRYRGQHAHMKSHVTWEGVLCLNRVVLRRAFFILKGHLKLEVGIAREMREYLESALNEGGPGSNLSGRGGGNGGSGNGNGNGMISQVRRGYASTSTLNSYSENGGLGYVVGQR